MEFREFFRKAGFPDRFRERRFTPLFICGIRVTCVKNSFITYILEHYIK